MPRNPSAPGWAQLDKRRHPWQFRVDVSLYQVQKLLFHVNRDRQVRARFLDDRAALVGEYALTEEERQAVLEVDFHALYGMGVHSLLLAPLAASLGMSFPEYLAALRGVAR